MGKFTIANLAGGDLREFSLRGGAISGAAIRHADGIGYGGPVFAGEDGEKARAAYESVCEDRESDE